MQIYEHGVEVAEVNKRLHHAWKFAKRSKRRIFLERTSDHKFTPYAIRVIGKSKGWFFERRKCIGYVPADVAVKLIDTGIEDKVMAHLQLISINNKHSVEIRFDILGPKNDYKKYSSRH
jgi:hypothetical protein